MADINDLYPALKNNFTATSTVPKAATTTPNAVPTTAPVTPAISSISGPVQVTPNAANPNASNQINVSDYAGQLIGDPSAFFMQDNPATTGVNESMSMTNQNAGANYGTATQVNGADPKYAMNAGGLAQTAATAGPTATISNPTPKTAATYTAATTEAQVKDAAMTAAQGKVSDGAIIDASETPQIDMKGAATGVNADGTVNETGKALSQYASQNISNVIDTSTIAGKMLASALGEGNYLDAKATLKGQLDILSAEFVDSATGEPKIPTWAAGTARNVSKIAAFSGMTGSAATAAMAQAIMEASIPVAQSDATFYQTLTVKNLDNKQQSTINRASVLAKFDLANMDTRLAVAVQNAKSFMDMDLANLANDQQARVINTQARVQSILEDAKAINAQRLFTAESQNDMTKFYDNLSASIEQFNASQTNEMKRYDTDQINSMLKFNSELENNRQQFEQTMSYNIDISNAKWRNDITLQSNEQIFQSAATDVQNMVGISKEQLAKLWDRADALLDYAWKTADNELTRANNLAVSQLNSQTQKDLANMAADEADKTALGGLVGSIVTEGAKSFFKDFSW